MMHSQTQPLPSSNTHAHPASHCSLIAKSLLVLLLTVQALLLGYSATGHSPTHLEPAFLASGVSHWKFGRFELYRVNPPLPRMIAAVPLLFTEHETDWSAFYDGPGARSEYGLGTSFIKANGAGSIRLFILARWACIPFCLLGAYIGYRWATELYGQTCGLVALTLLVFDPNLLAHGELVTPDSACTAFGILAGYTFWRWLKNPTWITTFLAGGALGLAELSKLSWLILFGLWPALWILWRGLQWRDGRRAAVRNGVGLLRLKPLGVCANEIGNQATSSSERESNGAPSPRPSPPKTGGEGDQNGPAISNEVIGAAVPPLKQLFTIVVFALYLLNLGYAFDGFGTRLGDFQFVSTTLSGQEKPGTPGNRFQNSWIGSLPVPLPKQYVLGADSQKKDLEEFSMKSYLRGEWKKGGWWYYYLYGLLVKVPCGTWGLLALVLVWRCGRRAGLGRFAGIRDLATDVTRDTGDRASLEGESSGTPSPRPSPPETGERETRVGRLEFAGVPTRLRDELILLTPAVTLLVIVSSQTEFNIHLRYVFPALALFLIFIGQAGSLLVSQNRLAQVMSSGLLAWTVVSSLLTYPNHLSYFNEFVGGSRNGHKHLLGSSYDWGQDWLAVAKGLQPDETIPVNQSSPLDYTLIFPAFQKITIEELTTNPRYSSAIVSWSEQVSEALASNRIQIIGNRGTLLEVAPVTNSPKPVKTPGTEPSTSGDR